MSLVAKVESEMQEKGRLDETREAWKNWVKKEKKKKEK